MRCDGEPETNRNEIECKRERKLAGNPTTSGTLRLIRCVAGEYIKLFLFALGEMFTIHP